MNSLFGSKIRLLREKQRLYLRQIAPLLEMDTAQLSKIEKGLRQMKKELIGKVADIYETDEIELEALWLADRLINVLKDSEAALLALSVAGNQIKELKYKL